MSSCQRIKVLLYKAILPVLLLNLNFNSFVVAQVPERSLELDVAINIALCDNPNLAQMQERYLALAEIPSQVGSLPDPYVNLNAMNMPTNSFDLKQEAMTQMQVGFMQAFPFPGKLALRKEASKYEAIAASNDFDETRLKLIEGVKSNWWQLYFLDRSLDIIENNLRLLRQFVKIAQTKYGVGDGLQQDVLLAQLELSKLLDRQIQLKSFRRTGAAKLNTLMGVFANRTIVLPLNIDKTLPDVLPEDILYQKAELRPLLAKDRNLINAARSRLKLANKEYYPDFKFGVNYGFRQGKNPGGGSRDDFLSIMLSIDLPVYAKTKQSRGVVQRKRELTQKNLLLHDSLTKTWQSITETVSEYTRAREQFVLFKTGIIPQASQTVESMLAGYRVSEVDFLNLVLSQITLYNFEMMYWKALTEANQALAKLVATVGEESIYE